MGKYLLQADQAAYRVQQGSGQHRSKFITWPQWLTLRLQKHIERKEYKDSASFAADVELIFANAMTFNEDHTPIWEAALTLRVRLLWHAV